ncbi:hypothetical protein CC86DRAFT_410266 [Ophiobolus disseminans]|uniref:NTF2-like domain-containing protein n=1 Tax=Ophiobolus disseminans TaxID=1469910 RepID=A0A6A6ZPI4_9PLEO|nr:hypothetical protein CC86DRAFT_410266 [Ophiobolus disseminans]
MHFLSLLASFLVVGIIPSLSSAFPEPIANPTPDRSHDKQKCLSHHESRDIIERYINNFEVLDEASVNRTFTEDFQYESDSTNFILSTNPGTKTITSRSGLITSLRADQTVGPAFTVTVNQYTHTCDSIILRYRFWGGRASPSAVGGLDWLVVDLKSRKIKSSQSEFNSAAILFNFGVLGTPNATSCLNGACEGEGKLVPGCRSR